MNSLTQGVSLSQDFKQEHEKSRKHYVDQLQEFPYSFLMTDLQNKSKNSFESIKKGLEEALKVGYKTTLETARATNLLSYCLFCLGYLKEAIEETDRALALEDQQTNLVSLANKAFILTYMDYYDRAQEQILVLQKLKKQADFPYLVTKAKGELAFSYTRVGPLFYSQATRLFREILPNARGEEQFLWEFGLALTYRRAMHIESNGVIDAVNNQENGQYSEMTLDLLNYILRRSKSKNLQAKAYSEIALLLNRNRNNLHFKKKAGISVEETCNKALELDEKDYSVLVKTGRLFRYLKKTEMSRRLLQTAVSIRPSSTVFHHLGLTYKALATAEVYRGSSSCTRGRGSLRGTGDRRRGGRGRMSEEKRSELQKMVKTPNGNETKFSRSNPYIPKALLYLEEAVKFSKDENTRAVYDLALLHKALGEYDNALHLLLKIRNNKSIMIGAFNKVNAWEQSGLILKTMSKNETNEEEKKKLDKEGETMLRTALHEAMRLFSRTPSIQQQVCHVWNSFSTLLADIDKSDGNKSEKIREKARLLTLVSKHKESISLLQELKSISPQKENDPETLKLLIENYSETKDYESAAIFIDLLKCSSEGNPTLSLFGDKYYTQKVYIKAAELHLMTSCDKLEPTFDLARRFFRAAFTDIISESSDSSESWETSSSSDSDEADEWHVMILYDDRDEDMEKYANSLKSLLGDACGLGVTCMYEDVMPGMKRDGLLRNMKRSQLLIFIAGEKVSRNLKYFMEIAAERQSTVTLLVNTQKIPSLLSKRRNRPFPTEFLDFTAGSYTPDTANAVCSLFRFLIGIGEG